MNDSDRKALMEINTGSFRLEIYEWDPLVEGFVSSLSDWVKNKSEGTEIGTPDKKKTEKLVEEETKREKVSSAVMLPDHRLKRYGTTTVYKPILDFILEGAPDPFTAGDVSSLIGRYYKEALQRTLKRSTQDLYANRYIRYMMESDPPVVERYEDTSISPMSLYRRIKYTDEDTKGHDVADDIYDLAEKEGWAGKNKQINVASIGEKLPKYSREDILSGIIYLIKKRRVAQMPSDEIRF